MAKIFLGGGGVGGEKIFPQVTLNPNNQNCSLLDNTEDKTSI